MVHNQQTDHHCIKEVSSDRVMPPVRTARLDNAQRGACLKRARTGGQAEPGLIQYRGGQVADREYRIRMLRFGPPVRGSL